MWTKGIAVSGVVLFAVSIAIGCGLARSFFSAVALDFNFSAVSAGPCLHPLMDAQLEKRIMSEKESQALKVILKVYDAKCIATVTISAPKFDIGSDKAEKVINLKPLEERELIWVIAPKETGTYVIGISAGMDNMTLGVSVTNILGFSAKWAQVLFYIGGLFGPILTLPWWLEKYSKRKKAKDPNPS